MRTIPILPTLLRRAADRRAFDMRRKMYRFCLSLLFAALINTGCTTFNRVDSELVMTPGMFIEATTTQGVMRISYVDKYVREYTWDGHTKVFGHMARKERWYGSLGMYRPYGDGTMHVVLEEGQQHFDSLSAAHEWLNKKSQWTEYVWTSDGLVVGWKEQKRPKDGFIALRVDVWQIYVDGKKPDGMRNAQDESILISYTKR